MTSTLKTTAILLLALGAAAAPALAQDRAPRAGAPTYVSVVETAPTARKPRSGSPVASVVPASSELAFDATGAALLGATTDGSGSDLCGYKYCGGIGR